MHDGCAVHARITSKTAPRPAQEVPACRRSPLTRAPQRQACPPGRQGQVLFFCPPPPAPQRQRRLHCPRHAKCVRLQHARRRVRRWEPGPCGKPCHNSRCLPQHPPRAYRVPQQRLRRRMRRRQGGRRLHGLGWQRGRCCRGCKYCVYRTGGEKALDVPSGQHILWC